ncbi:MAG TPA: FecR domain-containing protein [Rhodocyclaceae bacterium]|nr:FecR domain-containing protein [Rhodocyclaceae bacterium]
MTTAAYLRRSLWALPLVATHFAFAGDWIYAIRPGDTLITIASDYLTKPHDWPELQTLNKVPDPKHLKPGSTLRIPLEWLRQGAAVATVIHIQGEAIRVSGNASSPLKAGDTLATGEGLKTGEASNVTLRFFDGSRLLIAQNSRIALPRLFQYGRTGMAKTTIRVLEGSVDTQVTKQHGPVADYRIESQALNLGVRGTNFRVGVESNGLTHSEVQTGLVQASAEKARGVALKAGFGTLASPGKGPAAPIALAPAPALQGLPKRIERLPLRFNWPAQPGAVKWRAQVFADRNHDVMLLDGLFDAAAKWADLPDGTYYLRVRAVTANGLEGLNAEHEFTVAARPEAPLALAPQDGKQAHGSPTLFRWAKPVDAASFHLQIATSADFAKPLFDQAGLTDTEHKVDLADGDYVWRIASVTASGRHGPFGDAHPFKQRPIPATPSAAQSEVDSDAVNFRWSAGEPGQTYHLQIARDAAFTQLVEDRTLPKPAYRLPRGEGGRFFLRMQTLDSDGFAGPYSQAQEIDVPAARNWWLLLLLPLLHAL